MLARSLGVIVGIAGVLTVLSACSRGDDNIGGTVPEPLLSFTGTLPGYDWGATLRFAMTATAPSGTEVDLVEAVIEPATTSAAVARQDASSSGTITGTLLALESVDPAVLGGIVDNGGGPPLCQPPEVDPPTLRMSGIRYQWLVTNDAGDEVGTVLYGEFPGLATGQGFLVGDKLYAFLLAETEGRVTGACQIPDSWDDPSQPPTFDYNNGWIEYDLQLVPGWNTLVGTVLETMNEGGDIGRVKLEAAPHTVDTWHWFRGGGIVRIALGPPGATYTIRRIGELEPYATGSAGSSQVALAPGDYTLVAELPGYVSYGPATLSVGPDFSVFFEIDLQPNPGE